MKLSVKQENFTKALNAVSRATTTRSGLPVLANILLRTNKNRLLIAATNLEIASITNIGTKIDETGEITVPAKILTEYVSNLPKGLVEVETKGNNITLKSGSYSSTINGTSSEDFPELPSIDQKKSTSIDINTVDFKSMVSEVLFASSSDTTRPILTGVLLHSHEGYIYAVGTDGYRLAERRIIKTDKEFSAVVPAQALQEVSRLIHDDDTKISILIDDTQIKFIIGDNEVISRLIDGKYPDYRQLIPAKADTNIEVSTTELVRTAKIASLFAREVGGSITIEADSASQTLAVKSITSEIGENTSVIPAKISADGKISLNSKFLSECLSVIDTDEVNISFSGKLSPIKLLPNQKNSDYLHIIMPLKS